MLQSTYIIHESQHKSFSLRNQDYLWSQACSNSPKFPTSLATVSGSGSLKGVVLGTLNPLPRPLPRPAIAATLDKRASTAPSLYCYCHHCTELCCHPESSCTCATCYVIQVFNQMARIGRRFSSNFVFFWAETSPRDARILHLKSVTAKETPKETNTAINLQKIRPAFAKMAGYLKPFESVSFTPPHGRSGHSVPTPRPLGGPPQELDENVWEYAMNLLIVYWLLSMIAPPLVCTHCLHIKTQSMNHISL